jgi:serine/threonine protein kinase
LATNKKSKRQVCVKVLECFSDDEAEDYYQEIFFMNKLSSPFIISMESNFVDGDSVFIVMEFCPNGDATGLIKKCRAARTFIPEWVWFMPKFFSV